MLPNLRRAVWMLGASQTVYWGVLYYGFSVLLVPMETELGLSRIVVAGAFSASLLVTALAAPLIGRWIDRDRGAVLMRVGVCVAVAGLFLNAQITTPLGLYVAWIVIGIAMAALLYEPAFGLVIRTVDDSLDRLRALATVTIFGGLASTVFMPLVGFSVVALGWRNTQIVGITMILVAAWGLERYTFPVLTAHRVASFARSATVPAEATKIAVSTKPRGYVALVAIFVMGTLASMGLTTLLIPLLIERGHSASAAAIVLAMLGVAQLPGRIWMLHGGHGTSLNTLVTLPLILQAAGLGIVAVTPNVFITALGIAIFGVGAGLQTLARPWLIQQLYGAAQAGHWNSRVARLQGLARAAGPIGAAALSMTGGTAFVFGGLSLAVLGMLPFGWSLLRCADGAQTSLNSSSIALRNSLDLTAIRLVAR